MESFRNGLIGLTERKEKMAPKQPVERKNEGIRFEAWYWGCEKVGYRGNLPEGIEKGLLGG